MRMTPYRQNTYYYLLLTTDWRMRMTPYRQTTYFYLLLTTYCWLLTHYYYLLTTATYYSLLLTTTYGSLASAYLVLSTYCHIYYLLLITDYYCSLLTTHYLILIFYYVLLTTCYLLLTAYHCFSNSLQKTTYYLPLLFTDECGWRCTGRRRLWCWPCVVNGRRRLQDGHHLQVKY